MKVGDLVRIREGCPHWAFREGEEPMLSVVTGFEQDLELNELGEYMWRVHLVTTCGLAFWIHQHWREVLSDSR